MNQSLHISRPGKHHFRSVFFAKSCTSAEKFHSFPANATILLDLEDSITTANKPRQRSQIRRLIEQGIFKNRTVFIRINGPDQPSEMHADLMACLHSDIDGLMIPMIQNAAELHWIEEIVQRREESLQLPKEHNSIIPLIERPAAVLNLDSIARSSSRVVALAFGHVDYCIEMQADIEEECYSDAQSRILMTARANQLAAISTVYLKLDNEKGFQQQNKRMKSLGFDGCFALTPKQMNQALKIFSHTKEEIEYSRRVLEVYETQGSIGMLDGEMIGPPMIKRALKIMEQFDLEHKGVA